MNTGGLLWSPVMNGLKKCENKEKGICHSGEHKSVAEIEIQLWYNQPWLFVKMNCGWQWFFESLTVQILRVEKSHSKIL